jgi:LPS-assembly protein
MRFPSSEPPVRLAVMFAGLLLAAVPQAQARQAAAPAQARPAAAPDTGFEACQQWTAVQVDKNHITLSGAVECRRGDLVLFADEAEIWTDTHRVVLTGNVTFRQRNAQIAADRAEFNSETRLGTFHNASGFATITAKAKKNPMGGQEPDVYFYGDTIEKIGADRYRITHGAFTTCVQPTPRWQITARTVTLRLDHYALLKNAVMEAKGVPVFYLPAVYYPITKDDRATGFLMPTYGTSTYRGWSLSNAFFWAIDRSEDLTLVDDWFSSRGNGMGAEYRYASGPGSTGFMKFYRLSEHASTIQNTDGSSSEIPGDLSYKVQATVAQALGRHWSLRASVDYFTNLTVQQAYNTNIYDASNSTRTYSGAITGSLAGFTVNGQYDRTEYFFDAADSTVTGGTPRVTLTRNERPLFGTPLYFSMNSEYVTLTRETMTAGTITDRGLKRADLMPTLRFPFTKWPFLTINSSVSWRGTYWSRSQSPDGSGAVVDDPLGRSYFDARSRITGPVFTRVWSTPDNGFAEKWKHSFEPYLNLEHVTAFGNFNRIVQLDGTDYILGGTTQLDYGLTNRLMAKRKTGGSANAKEILSVVLSQTYYSNPQASLYDSNYSTSFSGLPSSHYSPVRLTVRATPTDQLNGSFKLEYDQRQSGLQSVAADAQVSASSWLRLTGGYSERLTSLLVGVPQRDRFVNGTVTLKSDDNRVGGSYSFNYDLGRSTMLTSRVMGYYNAQCCGFALEYQTYSFGQTGVLSGLGSDRRFNFTFTLAGLGTFSNFFGALGGGGTPLQ